MPVHYQICCHEVRVLLFADRVDVFAFIFTEPDGLCVHLWIQWLRHGRAWQMSTTRLPGGLPHLPVCDLCLQHDWSYGPDPLCHHSHQVTHLSVTRTKTSVMMFKAPSVMHTVLWSTFSNSSGVFLCVGCILRGSNVPSLLIVIIDRRLKKCTTYTSSS